MDNSQRKKNIWLSSLFSDWITSYFLWNTATMAKINYIPGVTQKNPVHTFHSSVVDAYSQIIINLVRLPWQESGNWSLQTAFKNLLFMHWIKAINLISLRGPAPKKRPMISSSKIKSADIYLPRRGCRVLFKNEFLLIQFGYKLAMLWVGLTGSKHVLCKSYIYLNFNSLWGFNIHHLFWYLSFEPN